jgi:uncharacterized protein YbaR (Trm112 family)
MHRRYLRLKACPRCKGDILVDMAIEGAEVCIQCGYRKFLVEEESPAPASELAGTTELKLRGRPRKVVERR